MTTVIADLRTETPILVADSLGISMNLVNEVVKIATIVSSRYSNHESAMIGWAGTQEDGLRFLGYLKSIKEENKDNFFNELILTPGNLKEYTLLNKEGGFMCLMIYRPENTDDGQAKIYQINEDLVAIPVARNFHAIGSGSKIALGAMAYGANALEALEIAASLDIDTGSPYYTLNLYGHLDKIK